MRWLREHRGWVLIVPLFLASQYISAPRLHVGVVLWLTALPLLLRKLQRMEQRTSAGVAV